MPTRYWAAPSIEAYRLPIPVDPVMQKQLIVIAQIIRDETWLEGERRGFAVSPHDAVVTENVCRVVLRIGAQLRQSFQPPTRMQRIQKSWLMLWRPHAWRRVGARFVRWLHVELLRTRSTQQTPWISS